MKLVDYLAEHGLTPESFATSIGDASASGVRKWISGERVPRPSQMRRIAHVTGGRVFPNDFILDDAAPSQPDASAVVVGGGDGAAGRGETVEAVR